MVREQNINYKEPPFNLIKAHTSTYFIDGIPYENNSDDDLYVLDESNVITYDQALQKAKNQDWFKKYQILLETNKGVYTFFIYQKRSQCFNQRSL